MYALGETSQVHPSLHTNVRSKYLANENRFTKALILFVTIIINLIVIKFSYAKDLVC